MAGFIKWTGKRPTKANSNLKAIGAQDYKGEEVLWYIHKSFACFKLFMGDSKFSMLSAGTEEELKKFAQRYL